MARYHGFTCPKCGSHYFGTHEYHALMGDKYKPKTKVGTCHENGHSGNGCTFSWDRSDTAAESECMYEQTHEEWMADKGHAYA